MVLSIHDIRQWKNQGKKDLDSFLIPCLKISSQWITDLNTKGKIIRILNITFTSGNTNI